MSGDETTHNLLRAIYSKLDRIELVLVVGFLFMSFVTARCNDDESPPPAPPPKQPPAAGAPAETK